MQKKKNVLRHQLLCEMKTQRRWWVNLWDVGIAASPQLSVPFNIHFSVFIWKFKREKKRLAKKALSPANENIFFNTKRDKGECFRWSTPSLGLGQCWNFLQEADEKGSASPRHVESSWRKQEIQHPIKHLIVTKVINTWTIDAFSCKQFNPGNPGCFTVTSSSSLTFCVLTAV